MSAPLPVGARVDIVAPGSQMDGEWGTVAADLGDGSYLVSPWGDDAAQLFDRDELRPARTPETAEERAYRLRSEMLWRQDARP